MSHYYLSPVGSRLPVYLGFFNIHSYVQACLALFNTAFDEIKWRDTYRIYLGNRPWHCRAVCENQTNCIEACINKAFYLTSKSTHEWIKKIKLGYCWLYFCDRAFTSVDYWRRDFTNCHHTIRASCHQNTGQPESVCQ